VPPPPGLVGQFANVIVKQAVQRRTQQRKKRIIEAGVPPPVEHTLLVVGRDVFNANGAPSEGQKAT
jgi:hypothetical protein